MKMDELLYYNGIGGFSNDGKEYIIKIESETTPLAWSHIIANERFGSIVSTSGVGMSWCDNSRDNRLTSWNNDAIIEEVSEAIYVGTIDDIFCTTPIDLSKNIEYTIKYGFGYAIYSFNKNDIYFETKIFIPTNSSKKVSILSLKNNTNTKKEISLYYYINPVLGVSREYTKKHLNIQKEGNIFKLTNNYSEIFSNRIMYVTSSEIFSEYTFEKTDFFENLDYKNPNSTNKRLENKYKVNKDPAIISKIDIILEPYEEKEIVFLLGQEYKGEFNPLKILEYNISDAKNDFEEVDKYWKNILRKYKSIYRN